MRYKLEIHLLFSRAVTTTDILFKEEDKKKGGEGEGERSFRSSGFLHVE